MKQEKYPYIRQIFVCTNMKEDDKPCCAAKDGEKIFRELRETAKARGLHPQIRVAQAKCLGQCSTGTNVMIYPEEIWYKEVALKDTQYFIDKYITPPAR